MTGCPALEELEAARPSAAVRAHVAACEACRLVVELIDVRSQTAAARSEVMTPGTANPDCARFEPLLASDVDDLPPVLAAELSAHVKDCADCRLLVADLAQESTVGGDHDDHGELPEIDLTAYALGAEVARGGMGRIVVARDLRVGRQVAVKELLGRSPEHAARFEREARVTARLQHPGIVPIYEIGRWPDGTPFYSMRLVEGESLHAALAGAATLDARLALLPAVIAATDAIAFAHSHRVIHRDLKPANILVGAYGETVVIDWGLAKDLAHDDPDGIDPPVGTGDSDLTAAGQVIGTAPYMPPEQACGDPVDERADVYAIGAMLYHLLAGAPPFIGRNRDVLRAVRTGPPRPIEAAAPEAPRELTSIVAKAMLRDPAQRYPTAGELAEELKRFQTGRLVEAHVYSRWDLGRRWIRRNRGAVIVAVVALAALAIAATISIQRVIHERDRAEAERGAAVMASARLLEEQGRHELLDGNPMRAAAWLAQAYATGDDAPSLRLLLGLALRDVELLGRTFDCHGEVEDLEVDPSGTRLIAACDAAVLVWRIADGAELASLSAPGAQLASARFSHDGATILSFGLDGTARLWDAATGALRHPLVGHGARIFSGAFTPDDRTVVTTGFDGTARMWNVADGAPGRVIQVSRGLRGIRGTLAPDGKTLITATSDGHGTAWDLATGAILGTIDHGSQIVGGNLSPDGSRASTCGTDRTVRVWDAHTGALERTLAGHASTVLTCKFSPDGTRILTTSQDGSARIWDLASGRVLTAVSAGGVVGDGKFSPDGRRFTTVGLDGTLRVWAVDTGALIASLDDPGGGVIHCFSTDGGRVFAARKDGVVREIDLTRTRLRIAFTPPDGAAVVGANDDGTRLVSRDPDDRFTVWDTTTGAAIAHPVPPAGWSGDPMTAAGFPATPTPAGAPFVVRAGTDAVARVHDAGDDRELAAFPIARLAPTLGQSIFVLTSGTARLAPDAGAVVIVSTGVAVWDLPIEQRSAAAVADLVHRRLPWQISGGRLVERGGELRGRIVTAGQPVAGAAIELRRRFDTVDGSVVGADDPAHRATSAADGTYHLAIPVGRYDLEVARPGRDPVTRVIRIGPDGAVIDVDLN